MQNSLKPVTAGNLPEEINVIIEIPANSSPVKYEIDKDTGAMFVDRFISTPMFYPCNYGFVPETLSDDGDPAVVLAKAELAAELLGWQAKHSDAQTLLETTLRAYRHSS